MKKLMRMNVRLASRVLWCMQIKERGNLRFIEGLFSLFIWMIGCDFQK